MEGCKKSIAFVCNVDYFFISHRLPLAEHAISEGWRVYILTKDTGRRVDLEKKGLIFIDIPFERSGINPFHEIKCICKLIKVYKEIKPTIIHHITLKSALLGSIASKWVKHKQVINAISGFGYNFSAGRSGLLQQIIKILITISFKSNSFRFILQNPDDLEMVKSLNLVPIDNLFLIKGSGVNLGEYKYSQIKLQEKLIFLFPARLLYDKGLKELIEAAKELQFEYQNKIKFVLAGDVDPNNLASITEEELKAVLVDGYIEWIGFQKNMYPIYVQSNIVVLPSYREGLPKSLIEACAVGRPIITTNVPGCKECVINNLNGLLIEERDVESLIIAIKSMIDFDLEKLSFMGQESRKLAEKDFSIDSVIQKTFEIYNSSFIE